MIASYVEPPRSSNRELTPRPQLRSHEVKRKHSNYAERAQASQETNPPSNPQVDEQRPSEQDTSTSERRSEEVIPGKQRSCILRVAERDIDKDALHDDKDRGGVDGNADDGGNPMDIGIGGPREDEESNGRAEAAKESGDEAVFLDAKAILPDIGFDIEIEVGDIDCDTDETSD